MRIANYTDKNLVAEILVSAFLPLKGENSINLVVKQDEKRVERMKILMEYLFEKAFNFGEIYISNNDQACILLSFPYTEKTTLKTICLDFKLANKCIGFNRVFKVLKRQQKVKHNYPKGKYIIPLIMGVTNECKGNGTAARLMLEVKNYHKKNKLPVIVDAASKKNVKLYQKFGFKVFKEDKSLGFPICFLRLN
ncbi:Acetyltransferase (GNAT) domain-containing protein [Lutibacter oricola]|uniref:Acetyltransferase (GNAT) domain-containing protein n=1 Tax=Lutibacter oricola TaxID=762486 RepID=A0A1H2RED6_9FLAO|nr:GNAT family N-acetyltransferase [Lutibacter oricola]SDW17853.1 Acetyltransferase (GNAT) domain-containing protein [Lutibacter oricola]